MENLIIQNYKEYINKPVGDWIISECDDIGSSYAIILKNNSLQRVFFIRKTVINASVLKLDENVYELWYKDFLDSKLLTLSEVLDIDIVISKIQELLNKYE